MASSWACILPTSPTTATKSVPPWSVLPNELDSRLAWVACIADAQPFASYENYLTGAGFRIEHTEVRDEAVLELVNQIGMRLLGAEIMVGLEKLDLPGVDLSSAKQMAQAAQMAVKRRALGYSIICGVNG